MSRKLVPTGKPERSDTRDRRAGRAGPGSPDTPADRRAQAGPRPTPPTEDFAARPDIETADEPAAEHDLRHHDGARPA
jgi:hypothetical protein